MVLSDSIEEITTEPSRNIHNHPSPDIVWKLFALLQGNHTPHHQCQYMRKKKGSKQHSSLPISHHQPKSKVRQISQQHNEFTRRTHIRAYKVIITIRALNINVRGLDVRANLEQIRNRSIYLFLDYTHSLARANNGTNIRVILARCCALDVREKNVGNSQLRRILVAQSEIFLSIALSHFNGVVDVIDCHGIIGNVLYATGATSTL